LHFAGADYHQMSNQTEQSRCHLDWGADGAARAARDGNIVVIVDVLSFSTSVVAAVAHGATIYPCLWGNNPEELAKRVGAEVAVKRRDVPRKGRFSLSPLTYIGIQPGAHIVLTSPNGASCSALAEKASYQFIGSLVNASAVAKAVNILMESSDRNVTLVSCGELIAHAAQLKHFRFALEDYLGAGAILSLLPYDKSPEADVCVSAFRSHQSDLTRLLLGCTSGREQVDGGFAADVEFAARLGSFDTVPVMQNGAIGEFHS
jgi:2-phosphosulfolactate phosphatase